MQYMLQIIGFGDDEFAEGEGPNAEEFIAWNINDYLSQLVGHPTCHTIAQQSQQILALKSIRL